MDDSSPGDVLRQAREKAGFDLTRVASEINASVSYLDALETDNLNTFPSLTYYKGFLRIYSDYLGLDFGVLLEKLDILRQQRAPLPAELLKRSSRWQKWWWWVLLLVCALGVAGAVYWWVL